jgi:uncharacterized protein (TIRG00374 family)
MRRSVLIVASVLVSGLFLWLAVRDVPTDEVIARVGQANVGWMLASLVMAALGMVTRAIRWRGLLSFKMSLTPSFHIVNIMFMLNLLPLRAGEIARSLLATREQVPFMTAATSIVVERLLDTLLVVVVLAVALSRAPSAPALATQSAALFGIAAVVGFGVLVFFARYPQAAHRLLALSQRILPFLKRLPLEQLLDHVIDGLQPLTHWRSMAHAVVWTLLSWGCSLGTFYCVHRALDIQGVDLVLSAALALTLASFSIAVPVSVAGVGPFEYAVKLAGEAVNMAPTAATSLGFLLHGLNVLSYALWGVIGMLAMGVSLADMVKAAPVQGDPIAAVSGQPSANE